MCNRKFLLALTLPCSCWLKPFVASQGDINDKASLTKALAGAHSVYAVTNYWEKMDHELEVQQGKNIADICKVRSIIGILGHNDPCHLLVAD